MNMRKIIIKPTFCQNKPWGTHDIRFGDVIYNPTDLLMSIWDGERFCEISKDYILSTLSENGLIFTMSIEDKASEIEFDENLIKQLL